MLLHYFPFLDHCVCVKEKIGLDWSNIDDFLSLDFYIILKTVFKDSFSITCRKWSFCEKPQKLAHFGKAL